MPSDVEIDALIERLNELDGRVGSPVAIEAAAFLATLCDERDKLEKYLRTVQNAAKTIASAQGTELEHLRQNRTYDHKLRQEHESLLERDAQMTDALLAAEARVRELEQKLERARLAMEPFGQAANDAEEFAGHDGPIGQYIQFEILRRARATLAEIGQRG